MHFIYVDCFSGLNDTVDLAEQLGELGHAPLHSTENRETVYDK